MVFIIIIIIIITTTTIIIIIIIIISQVQNDDGISPFDMLVALDSEATLASSLQTPALSTAAAASLSYLMTTLSLSGSEAMASLPSSSSSPTPPKPGAKVVNSEHREKTAIRAWMIQISQ
jgi:hypothetical protein